MIRRSKNYMSVNRYLQDEQEDQQLVGKTIYEKILEL